MAMRELQRVPSKPYLINNVIVKIYSVAFLDV